MYLWNVRKLADELKSGSLTEWQKMRYFLWSNVLAGLFLEFLLMRNFNIESYYGYFFLVVNALFVYLFIQRVFLINEKGDSKDFIERVVCLGIPIGIRIFALLVIIGVVLSILLLEMGFEEGGTVFLLYKGVSTLAGTAYYYYVLAKWIKYISGVDESTSLKGVEV